MRFTDGGIIKMKNKEIGKYSLEKQMILGYTADNIFTYNPEDGLFIYYTLVDNSRIPAFGTCEVVK